MAAAPQLKRGRTTPALREGAAPVRDRLMAMLLLTAMLHAIVLLVDGEPVPYVLARIPSATDHRGNLAAGAQGVGRPLSDRERWLCQQIGPAMREAGMLFVGLDVIGGYVTEINVTSPTGARELDKQFHLDIGDLLMAAIGRAHSARAR